MEKINLANTCRLCLTKRIDENNSAHLFEDYGEIAADIYLLSGVKILDIQSINGLARACYDCLDELQNAIRFRDLCIKSDKYYRQMTLEDEEICWNKKLIAQQFNLTEGLPESSEIVVKCEPSTSLYYEPQYMDFSNIPYIHPRVEQNVLRIEKKAKPKKIKANESKQVAKKFPCPVCKKLFSRGALWGHKKKFHKEVNNSIKCHHCFQVFSGYIALERHMNKDHDIQKEHTCDMCGKIYESRSKIKHHLKNFHQYYEKGTKANYHRAKLEGTLTPYPCSICGKIFTNINVLRKHEKTHKVFNPEDYRYCDLCGNKFKEKTEVVTHMKFHHIEKRKYQCPRCEKSFFKKGLLMQHIKVDHFNIKEFRCEFCGKEFGRKQKLVSHIRIHTGEMPFQCKYCERKFRYNTDCRRHEWKHTGYKGHIKCPNPNCEQRFMRNNDLQAHLARCNQMAVHQHPYYVNTLQ